MLCDKISRKVHLDQRFRFDLRLTKPRIYSEINDILSKPSTYTGDGTKVTAIYTQQDGRVMI